MADRYALHIDVPVSRRKYWHMVTNPAGEVVYTDAFVSGCLRHLRALEVEDFDLYSTDTHMRLMVHKIARQKRAAPLDLTAI